MLACDNCVPGQAGQWKIVLIGVVLIGTVSFFVVLGWAFRRGWTNAGRAASVALVLAVLGASSAGFPVSGDGAICGSAVAASRERGWPDDSALDHFQLACKRNGQALVHASQLLFVAAALVMVLSLLFLISGVVRSPGREGGHLAPQ